VADKLARFLVAPATHYAFALLLATGTGYAYLYANLHAIKWEPSVGWLGFIVAWAGIPGVANDLWNTPPTHV
jgi:hypothetical protein